VVISLKTTLRNNCAIFSVLADCLQSYCYIGNFYAITLRTRITMHKIDTMDRRLLTLLQQNGSLTNQELAEQVGLSASPCSRRIKALEDAGIILRRTTLLDPRKLGLNLTALISISMDRHTPERFELFEQRIKSYPEVLNCYLITGQQADYLLQVVVPDMDAYQAFLLNKITRIEGVSGVHSSFVLRRVQETNALPLSYLPA
jgi:Lrp/AsnC family leucine-responsive transcriptional regulator